METEVVSHDPGWSVQFTKEAKRVGEALGATLVRIHHIGSTAIPGIHAKPIIDMLAEVRAIEQADTQKEAMLGLGYEALGEFGIAGRRYFRKNNHQGKRVFHVHVFVQDTTQVIRHLAFRDFMRAHPAWAQQYSDLKRKLAAAHLNDSDAYMDGKDAFIQDMDKRAALWLESESEPGCSRH